LAKQPCAFADTPSRVAVVTAQRRFPGRVSLKVFVALLLAIGCLVALPSAALAVLK
jgi:hypothetical protein